jgi:hypothetical protein
MGVESASLKRPLADLIRQLHVPIPSSEAPNTDWRVPLYARTLFRQISNKKNPARNAHFEKKLAQVSKSNFRGTNE